MQPMMQHPYYSLRDLDVRRGLSRRVSDNLAGAAHLVCGDGAAARHSVACVVVSLH